MKITQLKSGVRYCKLPLSLLCKDADDFIDSLRVVYCDPDDCRQLLANLFHRFSYPNSGWDRCNEVACYRLTTSNQDMILQLVPYVGGNSSLRISFLVPDSVMNDLEAHDTLARRQWQQRMNSWLEENLKVPEAARNEFIALYSETEPQPPRYQREKNWRAWDDGDPVKPFFEAAYDALQDLKRSLVPSISPSMLPTTPSVPFLGRLNMAMPGAALGRSSN